MRRYEVLLTDGAEQDPEGVYDYIVATDSHGAANRVLDRLSTVAEDLSDHPERGSHPRELLSLGIREYRQVFFKPYRVIYRIVEHRVYIMIVADGRRDMEALLTRCLLGA